MTPPLIYECMLLTSFVTDSKGFKLFEVEEVGLGLMVDEEVGVFGQDCLRISTFQIVKWFRKFMKLFFPMSPFFKNKCPPSPGSDPTYRTKQVL